MFATRPDARQATITVFVNGNALTVPAGASAAAAVLLTTLPALRTTPVGGAPRLPYCMMGVCFDCLAVIDGVANRQSCMVPVTEGMRIEPQIGVRHARPDAA
jgi:hypothetical protein